MSPRQRPWNGRLWTVAFGVPLCLCLGLVAGCGSRQGRWVAAPAASASAGPVTAGPSASPSVDPSTASATPRTRAATSSTSAANALRGNWDGTVDVTLDHHAPCGTNFEWIKVGTRSYRHDVQVTVAAPESGDANAFQLSIVTDGLDVEGGVSIASSGRFNTSTGPVTLVYWTLRVSGGQITGRLDDTHAAEGVAQNMVFTNKTLDPCSARLGSIMFPLAMDVGTTLSGRLGASTGTLEVTGRTTDWLRGYRLTFTLNRTG